MYRPKPRKLGHLVLKVRDIRKSLEFYTEVMGLVVSDWIDDRMVFLRASEGVDHHDLGLLQMPKDWCDAYDPARSGVEHFSYHVETLDEMEQIVAMLLERGIPIDRGFGKHGPGDNTFIVFKDPDGNNVEFYSHMIQIDKDHPHVARVWDGREMATFDQWGLERFVVDPPERIKAILPQTKKDDGDGKK